jgi:hypothetical protein
MLSLYSSYTVKRAVAEFGDPVAAQFFCDRQFAVVRRKTLCFATMGDPERGTKVMAPSTVAWKPARLDYHPERREPWFPAPLTRLVGRNGAWLPLHHMFLRCRGDRRFVYAGIAEMQTFGDIPDNGRVQQAAHFFLDAKLPRDLWVRLGGYAGRLVKFNDTQRRFALKDVTAFEEQLLASIPAPPAYLELTIDGYEEHWFKARFNARRAFLQFVPGGERRIRESGLACMALESFDPTCPTPVQREFFGHEQCYVAVQTVPREMGIRAAVEHFRTERLPECIRWRETKLFAV